MSVIINLGGRTFTLDSSKAGVEELLDFLSPIVPILLRYGQMEMERIIVGLLSKDPYNALVDLRKEATEAEWDRLVSTFAADSNKYNQDVVELRKTMTKTTISVLVSILLTFI